MVDDGGSTIERLCLLEILNMKREKQICLYYSKSYFKGGGRAGPAILSDRAVIRWSALSLVWSNKQPIYFSQPLVDSNSLYA